MKLICPSGHNKIETGFYSDGKCVVCKRTYDKLWAKKNPDKIRKYHSKAMRRYSHTLPGFLCQKYTSMQRRVRGQDPLCQHMKGMEIMPRAAFIAWCDRQDSLTAMFDRYRESGWDINLCPSIDRIDGTRGYTEDNVRFLTQLENISRSRTYYKGRLLDQENTKP